MPLAAAKQSLERSEARLRLAMEAAKLGSFEWDLSTGVVQWSAAIERMHGIPEGSFEGTFEAYRRDIHPDDVAHVLSTVQASVESGTEHHLSYRIIRPDGEIRWLEAHGRYEKDEYQRPVRLIGVCRDVTEQKVEQDRFRQLADTIPVQVWTATPDGMLDYVSTQVTSYFGMPESALLGTGWTQFVHADDVVAAGEQWNRCLATGVEYEIEFRLRRHDGTWRWHIARATPVRDTRGVVSKWFGSNTDIEDRRSAELARDRALREAEAARENLFRAVEQAPASISITEGPEHITIVQNRRARETGDGRKVIGIPARVAVPEPELQSLIDLLDHVYQTGEPYSGSEVPLEWDFDNDGSKEVHYFNIVYQPLMKGDGSVAGVLTHSVDVTDLVLARQEVEQKAEELARLAKALEQSNRELDQFAYVASHDLKAPLRGISNLAQWIEEDSGDTLSGDSLEHMRLLQGRVQRMEALIDGILAYSRAGRVRSRPERIDTGSLVSEVVEMIAAPPDFTMTIADNLPVVMAERVPMQQVFLNLVGNAIKFTSAHRSDGNVTISASRAGDMWEFSVSDNGPGIPAEYQERIWTIFQTLAPRDKVEGTGIGLSVVRKIVESRGGRTWVESQPGIGTTFRFTWPATLDAD